MIYCSKSVDLTVSCVIAPEITKNKPHIDSARRAFKCCSDNPNKRRARARLPNPNGYKSIARDKNWSQATRRVSSAACLFRKTVKTHSNVVYRQSYVCIISVVGLNLLEDPEGKTLCTLSCSCRYLYPIARSHDLTESYRGDITYIYIYIYS